MTNELDSKQMFRFCNVAIALIAMLSANVDAQSPRPNVLFLAIDDQNDWIGCLQGHPFARTPNIDRLARRGTLFSNAQCQAPLCNPSRTSVMLGLRPSTTGIYGLSPWFRDCPAWAQRVTLAQHFANHGYHTAIGGKIFHPGNRPKDHEKEFMNWGPLSTVGAVPAKKLIPETPQGNHPLMDWGSFPHRDEEKGDYQLATWTIDQLKHASKDQPFFLAAGFFLPHVPCYATETWFDGLPSDDSILPMILANDRMTLRDSHGTCIGSCQSRDGVGYWRTNKNTIWSDRIWRALVLSMHRLGEFSMHSKRRDAREHNRRFVERSWMAFG